MPRLSLAPFLASAAALVLAGCADHPPLPDGATACPSPRPRMCTMDYRPVQGFSADGTHVGEFSNSCRGCAEEGVTYTLPNTPN